MPLDQSSVKTETYNPGDKERERRNQLVDRIQELKNARETQIANPVEKLSIESVWKKADRLYAPHSYESESLRAWQSKISQPLGYVKLQTALALMIDQNPQVELFPQSKQYEKMVKLFEGLYNITWDKGLGRQQLRKFTFNAGKYGFAAGRTYYRKEERYIQEREDYSDPNGKSGKSSKKKIVDFDDVYFENLNIFDVWLDPNTKPDDYLSTSDWCFRKTYNYTNFKRLFPESKYPNAKYIKPGNKVEDSKDEKDPSLAFEAGKNEVELYFYENKEDDEFMILDAGGNVLLLDTNLPWEHKQLSLVNTYWTLRSSESPYGIGLMEIIEGKQELLDRIVNMRMDQIMLMIHKLMLYGGGEDIAEEDFEIEPGKPVKVYDVNNFKFLEIPGPGNESYKEEEMIREGLDEDTGITKTLSGQPIGKTAFEASINRESGLRRMKIPLDNIENALSHEAKLRINLIQQIYRSPQSLIPITDPKELEEARMEKAKLGPKGDMMFAEDMNAEGQMEMFRKQFRQVRLPFSKTPEGELEPSDQDQDFVITPEDLRFEGDVKVVATSTIPVSKALLQRQKLDTANMILKLPYTDQFKAEQQILKVMDEDPDDWMMTEEEIAQQQQVAEQKRQMMAAMQEEQAMAEAGGVVENPTQGSQEMGPPIEQLISGTNEAI